MVMDDIRPALPEGSIWLMYVVRADMRTRGYSYQTQKSYCHWIKRFILFHRKWHPERMGEVEVNAFLSYLVVLSHAEVTRILEQLSDAHRLMMEVLYGSVLRLNEFLSLRVKHIDLAYCRSRCLSGSISRNPESTHSCTSGAFNEVKAADAFRYEHPVDGSESAHQGIRIYLTDGRRALLRLWGTGTSGAMLRVRYNSYQNDPGMLSPAPQNALKPVIDALEAMAFKRAKTGCDGLDVTT